jgi:DHA2 family multidrug resistance protein
MIDWLSKLMGRKQVFMLGVFIFTLSSFCCGISFSMGMMVVARFFQGLGGGVIIPITQAIIFESFEGEELAKASTLFSLVVIIAPILGPVLGGWITDNWSWCWIYYINIPVGIVILGATPKLLEDPPYARKQSNVKTDYWGVFFLIIFAVAFETMMDKGNDLDWFGSPFICKLTVIWVIGLIGLIIAELKQKDSLIQFNVLKDHNFLTGTIAITVMNAVLLGSMAMLPQFMQTMMGYDAFTSGVSMMPRGVGCLLGCIVCGKLQAKMDGRVLSSIGIGILCIGSWMLGNLNLEISQQSIAIPNVLYGIGMAMGMIPLVTLSCLTVPNEQMSNASGLQNLIKTVGGAVGTSLVATFISRFSQTHQNMMIHSLAETNGVYIERLQAYTSQFVQSVDPDTARYMAENLIYNQLNAQAHLWAYIDSFRIFAIAGVGVICLIYLMQNKSLSD